MYINASSTITVINSTYANNEAISNGGGIFVGGFSNGNISGSTFNNQVAEFGEGCFLIMMSMPN